MLFSCSSPTYVTLTALTMPSNQDTPNESPHENVRAFASLDAFKSSRVTVIPYGSSEPTIPRVELELLGTDTNALGTARPSKPAFFPGLEPIIPPNGLKLLTPEIVAVLKYQREKIGPSIVTEPPSPGPPRPIRKKGREDELIYQRCNTCETFCGEYTYCDHESDDGEYDTTVNTNRIGERLKPVSIDSDTWEPPTSIGELEYEMLHPGNLSKLLTINTDQHVDQYVFVSFNPRFYSNSCRSHCVAFPSLSCHNTDLFSTALLRPTALCLATATASSSKKLGKLLRLVG